MDLSGITILIFGTEAWVSARSSDAPAGGSALTARAAARPGSLAGHLAGYREHALPQPPEYGREHLVFGAEVMRQRRVRHPKGVDPWAATGSSCRASHRFVRSVAVSLGRYCPVKLVIGP